MAIAQTRTDWRRRLAHHLIRLGLCAALFVAGVWLVPHRWCARQSQAWYDGRASLQAAFAAGVENWITSDLTQDLFQTGHRQYNGEWLFGTYLMAGMGFGQMALEHPERRTRHAELMSLCIERILSPQGKAFETGTWKEDPIESLDGDHGHAAYLGYLNLLLGLHRVLDPTSKHAPLNDRITAALVRRIHASPTLLLRTYPDEVYPVDNCAVIASIGLYDLATRADHSELIQKWVAKCRERYTDPQSGLLYQCVNADDGSPVDAPRGSGSSLGLYFLSFVDMALSRQLYDAVRKQLARTFLGFGVVREYPMGWEGGRGDVDSGPVLFGIGVSPTGFTLAGARIHRDPAYFSRLYSSAHLIGAPLRRGDRLNFVTGGPLGDAIMFAMLTAQPGLVSRKEARS